MTIGHDFEIQAGVIHRIVKSVKALVEIMKEFEKKN